MRTNDSSTSRWLLAPVLAAVLSLTGSAQTRDRAAVPDVYKWNLADLYPNEAAWQADKAAIAKVVPTLAQFKGKLGELRLRPGRRARKGVVDRQDDVEARPCTRACCPIRTRATRRTYGDAAGDASSCTPASRREASFIEPEVLRFPAGTVDEVRRGRAAAQGLPLLPRGHRPPRAAHAERARGDAARARRRDQHDAVGHLQRLQQRRLSRIRA